MKIRNFLLIGIAGICLPIFAQEKQRAVPGNIESFIDRFEENRVSKNKNGWAHYYIPKGMADTLTVKMSCVYDGTQTHPPHVHHEDEAFYIVQGPVNFHINGEEQILNTGDFIYTPSGSSHNIQRVNNDTIKYLVIKRETLKAVSQPYRVGKKEYTYSDCCSYLSKDPRWTQKGEARIVALDKTFADGFEIILERILDNKKVVSNKQSPQKGKQTALYILSGEAEVTLDRDKATLYTDNTFYCPKTSSYTLQKKGTTPLVFLSISTDK